MIFTDEELENYFRLRHQADEYLNQVIRKKRIEEYIKSKELRE